jgi:predicted dithiol-disulfide oxidoreductase (DUF899 family)
MPVKKRKSAAKKMKTATKKKAAPKKTKVSVKKELAKAEKQLTKLREKIGKLRRKVTAHKVTDYTLKDPNGNPVNLSSLFGDKDDLIIVHNMGKSCVYCTLWADGFTGFTKHFENRAGFALVSYDRPAVLKEFASGRGWNYTYLSNDGGPFAEDMGMTDGKGNPWPGVSTFHREKDGSIKRISHAYFGPGDDFCSIWHIFDMLKDGQNGWGPKYEY